jgi:hypothetical protein
MTIKVYDGSAWQSQKSLKLYAASAWNAAKKGWIHNGSSWSQFYPEYPSNSVAPAVSGSTTQGQTLSCTTGTWNTNDAFLGTYSYQWTRAGSNISSATSSTYSTVLADVGNAIACKVTSTNNRGTTTVTSSNSITVTSAIPGAPSGLSLSDATDTPPTPGGMSVSSVTDTGFNFSFGAASGTFTAYEVLTSGGSYYVASLNQSTRSGTVAGGTGGASYYIAPFTTNTNGKIGMSWSAGSNATSYDIYIGGTYITNTSNTSITITTGTTGSYLVNVRSRNSAGAETTGVSGNVTISKKYSSGGTAASGNFAATPVIPSFTVNPSVGSITTTGGVLSWSSSNQSTYSISAPGTALDGATGFTATSRTFTGLSSSTTYNYTVYIYSSTGHSTSYSSSFTTSSSGSAPSTPSGLSITYGSGPSWTGSWSASTGTAPITYYWTLTQSLTSGGATTATASGNTTSTTFTQSMNSTNGFWGRFTVYASNSIGTSGTATSSWA